MKIKEREESPAPGEIWIDLSRRYKLVKWDDDSRSWEVEGKLKYDMYLSGDWDYTGREDIFVEKKEDLQSQIDNHLNVQKFSKKMKQILEE